MTEVCTTAPRTASPNEGAYLTVNEAAGILRRKPWPVIEAIEAGELRASMPSNDGCWLIRRVDLEAYVDLFANDVEGGPLHTPDERIVATRARVAEALADAEEVQA